MFNTPIKAGRFLMYAAVALVLLPYNGYSTTLLQAQIQLRAEIVSFLNLVLFVTALVSVKQYFWPGDNNTMPFHIFNMVFAVLFYAISLPFLITHRNYYEGYGMLTPLSVLGKFFLSINISSFAQWVIIASLVINVLYIKRFRRDYFEAGIATEKETKKEIHKQAPEIPITKEEEPSAIAPDALPDKDDAAAKGEDENN